MAYTFGAAATDDANVTLPGALVLANAAFIVAGWFNINTLTAGRAYFGSGSTNTTMLAVGATTSELQLVIDRSTTDEVWDSVGAGITTGGWVFIAALWIGANAAGTSASRVWVGTLDQRPTVPATSWTRTVAGSGNVAGSSTHVIGNQNTGASVAIQADVENCWALRTHGTIGITQLLQMESTSTISADREKWILDNVILPMWQNKMPALVFGSSAGTVPQFINHQTFAFGDVRTRTVGVNGSVALGPAMTISGPTFSQSRGPRPAMLHGFPYAQPVRR